jgi:RNA polymerase sigma factor (sigma-70 family)
VLQETWLRACALLPRFRKESSLQTWLSGILINCWREMRRTMLPVEELQDVAVVQPETRDLERLIRTLPDRARAVLVLHDVEGHTHEEIAAALSIAAGTSKHHLFRARKLLREWLGEE